LSVFDIDSQSDELAAFESCCRRATDVLVIAPEFHDILLQRRMLFDSLDLAESVSWLGCDAQSIEVGSDKFRLSHVLHQHKIQGVPTELYTVNHETPIDQPEGWHFPIVIKPRDGVGSIATRRVDSRTALHELVRSGLPKEFDYIQQPYVAGQLVSVAAVFRHGKVRQVFPPAKQCVSSDVRFSYQGMDLEPEFARVWRQPVDTLMRDVLEALPGLNGYVGFDLIIPERSPASLIVLEINPRLTTGFLGWQLLFREQNRAAGTPNSGSFLMGSSNELPCTQSYNFRLDTHVFSDPTS
jgi:predicted ATP-grasp superfamily ATP-dependent carboligase